jgi:hypothetical protein
VQTIRAFVARRVAPEHAPFELVVGAQILGAVSLFDSFSTRTSNLAETVDECRVARRTKMPWSWPAEFSLPGEIEAICRPLAAAVAALPDPARLAGPVNQLAGAVYEAVTEVADMTTRFDALRRCAHVPVDERGRALRLLRDLAPPPPARPVIDEAALVGGDWAGLLVEIAVGHRQGLRELLAAAPVIDGEPLSDLLEAALARIDKAALSVQRAIEKLAGRQPVMATPAPADKADKARAELARLGVLPP